MMIRQKNNLFIEYKRVFISTGLILFFSLLLVFSYSRLSPIWRGIDLVITNPQTGQSVEDDLLYIEGVAKKAVRLTINGDNTFIGNDGDFSYPIPVHTGYNEIHIIATDKFDNETKKILKINGV